MRGSASRHAPLITRQSYPSNRVENALLFRNNSPYFFHPSFSPQLLEVFVKNNKQIIAVIGGAAVVLGLILYIALQPSEEQIVRENLYVVQLEADAERYAAQADSLSLVVESLNARIDTVRAQMDSARTDNKMLLTTLRRVTNESKEYQRLYKEQRTLVDKLRDEITRVKAGAATQIEQLKTSLDSLNNTLSEQAIRLTRMTNSLKKAEKENRALRQTLAEAQKESEALRETLQSVLVYVGTEDGLKQQGYLNTSRRFIRKNYKMTNFPDLDNSDIVKVGIGETFSVQGKLAALCDRHGKLGKGKEYELSEGQAGQLHIAFSDSALAGQRILAVLKN